jgi:hypothetical protein
MGAARVPDLGYSNRHDWHPARISAAIPVARLL